MIVDLHWKILDRVVSISCLLITQLVFARALGVAEFGLLGFSSACLALIAPLSKFGVGGVVTSYLRREPSCEAEILESAIAWRAVGAAISIILGLTALAYVEAFSALRGVGILVVLLQGVSILAVLDFYFEARFNSKRLVQCRIALVSILTGVKILAAIVYARADIVLLLQSIETALLSLASLRLYRKLEGARGTSPSIRHSHWVKTLGASIPWVLGAGVAEAVYLKIDVVILSAYSGIASVGAYVLASKISEAVYFLPLVAASSIFPYINKRNSQIRVVRLRRFLTLFAMAGIFCALGASLIGYLLIPALFGAEYLETLDILLVHVWAMPFVFMRGLVSRWFIEQDVLHLSFSTTLLAAILNIALNFALIPHFSGMGAALATVISYAATSFGFLFFFPARRSLATTALFAFIRCFSPGEYRWFYRWCRQMLRRT